MQTTSEILTRRIPSANESIPVIGLGTWQTFDVGNNRDAHQSLLQVLQQMIKHGATVVDSSPMYGSAETVAGELSTAANLNQKLFIATKVWTTGKENGIRQMEESFHKLRRTQIDLMQIHNLVDWQVQLKTLRRYKEEGKIRYLGITHYTESAYQKLEEIILQEPIDFLQINYSLTHRLAESRLFPLAQEKKIAVMVNRPLNEGKLFNLVQGKKLPGWAQDFDCHSWSQFFLKFILSHQAVTCVIPATAKPHNMIDNIKAACGKLPDEQQRIQMVKLLLP